MTNRKTYNKMMIRGVRGTMTRFLAILCIVALGTGFLCGLLSTMPDMRVGVDRYFDEQNAMDFLIQGSQGINEENVEALKKEDCIEYAHGKYTLDLLMKDSEGESYVTRAIGEVFTDETSVNKVSLVDGRLPEKTGECVIEIPNMYAYEVKVGETLVIDETNRDYEDMLDTLKTDTFKVTGIVRSPQFIYAYGDSSTVGDGTMVMAMYVPEDTFDMDYYTAVYATAKNARDQQLYTEEYDSIIDDATKDLEDLGTVQAKARTDQIRADAMEEYNDGLKEFRAPITVNADEADENFGAIRLKQSDGATIDIDPPKREGYQFKGWQFTYMEHGVEIEMDAPDKMRGHDIKATAVWEANQMVDYTIVYWQQKAVVKSDDMAKYPVDTNTYNSLIENYNYADSKVVTKGAKIGSKTSDLIAELEADTSDSGIKNKYPDTGKITYIYESSVGSSGELKIDGSTTINVFYNREIITYNVNWSGVSITDDVSHLLMLRIILILQ